MFEVVSNGYLKLKRASVWPLVSIVFVKDAYHFDDMAGSIELVCTSYTRLINFVRSDLVNYGKRLYENSCPGI